MCVCVYVCVSVCVWEKEREREREREMMFGDDDNVILPRDCHVFYDSFVEFLFVFLLFPARTKVQKISILTNTLVTNFSFCNIPSPT